MTASLPCERIRIHLEGAVQGVGFRPFVYRLATELHLNGWVRNSNSGLTVEVEGPPADTARFLSRLDTERPAPALILARQLTRLEPSGATTFVIDHSDGTEPPTTAVLPDLATCPECAGEFSDQANRRHAYPFTNCTQCGPRYSIVLDIPYDRPNTTMRAFTLCSDCAREYTDPANRRFHAQPNACVVCGPRIVGLPADAFQTAAESLAHGQILALKGIGGFQLLCDARNPDAVARLRVRKHREAKPFAVMMPDIAAVRRYCRVSLAEEALLASRAAPIVLLDPLPSELAANVVGSSPTLGVMLPYSPLHHLLLRAFPHPIVATSGNRSDEPIAIDNDEAHERLSGIADSFLLHDRPIARPCDDSVARILRGAPALVRRARGYTPLPIPVGQELPRVLAVGAHLKSTVAIAIGNKVVLSQHLGDLDTPESRAAFTNAIDDLCRLYRFQPERIVCDLHPDYASTAWARSAGLPVTAVQHHQAHAAACAAENGLRGPYLAATWDGSGYGLDHTIWGGEFFLVDGSHFERVAHLRPFRLPGGEAAIREGWRSAASLLCETFGPDALPHDTPHRELITRMIHQGVNAPFTTSVGRLFDAVTSLAGLARLSRFEGEAALRLERALGATHTVYAYPLHHGDWRPLIAALLADVGRGEPAGFIAAKFHNALVGWLAEVARDAGVHDVVLSGGVFQNRYLTERAVEVLERRGFAVHTHRQVPANDGGISLGQAVLAAGKE